MDSRLLLTILIISLLFGCEKALTSEEIINRSIRFHDPSNAWSTLQATYFFDEYRPDGVIRKTQVTFDLPNDTYEIQREGQYHYRMVSDSLLLISGEINPERAHTIKNYYLYLWGIPMKLADPQTPVGGWERDTLDGRVTYKVRINYEKDTWFYHFDQSNFEMVGYTFYQDSILSHGERIELDQTRKMGSILTPTVRKWYRLPEEEYLGKDVLTHVK